MSTKTAKKPVIKRTTPPPPTLDKNGKIVPQFKDMSVKREGVQIILPEQMSYAEGRLWLQREEESEEKVVAIHCQLAGFPLDGAVALQKAMEQVYGFTALRDTPGFFGSSPPVMVQIPIRDGTFITAPLGRMSPPMYEGGYLETDCQGMSLVIRGEIKRKYEDEVQTMLKLAKEWLQDNSIYKGAAFILDLSYKVEDRKFHPLNDAPKFMDVSNVDESGLILSRSTARDLDANVFMLLERTEDCRAANIPLKFGTLLAGQYGTGKTLTAKVMASKAVRNGWTYIYLKTGVEIAHALKLAEHYAPAVLFTEDIDTIICGERTDELNEVLNTLDGIDTKDKAIITVLTTNHPENINPAALRPGRIDKVITYLPPDAETAYKFVEAYAKNDDARSLLSPDVDRVEVGKAMEGYVPAFIAACVQQAKRFAMARQRAKNENDIMITTEDLVDAATQAKEQVAMVNRKKILTIEEKSHMALKHFGLVMEDHYEELPDFNAPKH